MAYPTRAPLNTEEFMERSAEITIAQVIHRGSAVSGDPRHDVGGDVER